MRLDAAALALIGTQLLLAGCTAPLTIELPTDPIPAARAYVQGHAPQPPIPVTFAIARDAAELALERNYEDRLHRYVIPVGAAVKATFTRLALAGGRPASANTRGALEVRVSAVRADCTLDRKGVEAALTVDVEFRRDGQLLANHACAGAADDELTNAWSLTVPERVTSAFTAALAQAQAAFVRAFAALKLRADEAAPLPAAATSPSASGETAEQGLARGLARIDALIGVGDSAGAASAASEVIRAHPAAAAPYQRRGALRLGQGELDAALADCFRALELDPALAEGYLTRARIYRQRGELERARLDCAAALAHTTDPNVQASTRRLQAALDQDQRRLQ